MDSIKIAQWVIAGLLGALTAALGLPAGAPSQTFDSALYREQIRHEIVAEVAKSTAQQQVLIQHLLEIHQLRGHGNLAPSSYIEKQP